MSSTTVGGINVAITASTQKFEKGVKRASGLANSFTRNLKNTALAVTGLGTALSAAGLTVALKRTFNQIESIGKAANRLGVSARSVRIFQVAAEEAEVSFSALTGGVQKLGISIEKAMGGDKEKSSAFARLGVDAKVLRSLEPEKQLLAISAGFGHLGAQSEKALVAQQLFGKGGIQLLGVLKNADGALAEATNRVDKFGGYLSKMGIRDVSAANDAFDDLKMTLEAIGIAIAVNIAPAVKGFAEWMQQAAASAQKAFDFVLRLQGMKSSGGGGGNGAPGFFSQIGSDIAQIATQGVPGTIANNPEGVRSPTGRYSNGRAFGVMQGEFTNGRVIGTYKQMSLHDRISGRITSRLGSGGVTAGGIAQAIGAAIGNSSLGRTVGQLGGAALGGLQQARFGASNFMNFSMPGIIARLQTDQLNRKGGQSIGYRGISASDPLSREGFSQRVRSLGQGGGVGKVAQEHLKEAKKQTSIFEKIAGRPAVTLAAANI